MIVNAGGKKVQIIKCKGCPNNASLLNRNCFNCIEDVDGVIFDKGVFTKYIENFEIDDWINIRENLLPGFCGFNLTNPKGKTVESYQIEEVEVKIVEGKETFYCVKIPETELEKEEIEKIEDGIEEIKKEYTKVDLKDCVKIVGDEKLGKILFNYTSGFDFLEYLVKDKEIQDIYINPNDYIVYVNHKRFGNIKTNIIVLPRELERLSSKFRLESKRPFDEAIPTIHLNLKRLNVRVTGIRDPITFNGIGFAIRKHNQEPWTIPMLIKEGMFNIKVGAILSLITSFGSSILITGNRGSGKTSLLGALLANIPIKERLIVIEDTDELPVDKLQKLGYNVAHLRIRATKSGYEAKAEDALRTALRLGESTLVIGEVRGEEAKFLFEAMRVGAIGNTVLGTIHGSAPYDVWDRIANDLGVASTSFKATDFIVSLSQIGKGEGSKRERKLISISYVEKNWSKEPKFTEIVKFDGKRWKIKNLNPLKEIVKRRKVKLLDSIKFREKVIENLNKEK